MKPPIYIHNPGYSPFQSKLIKLAFKEVVKCPKANKARIVSFLCERNKVLSIGHNNERKTHPLSISYNDRKLHAERHTILKVRHLGIKYTRCYIINIRIDRHNRIGNSCPCTKCVKFLDLLGIKKIIYTNANGFFEKFSVVS